MILHDTLRLDNLRMLPDHRKFFLYSHAHRMLPHSIVRPTPRTTQFIHINRGPAAWVSGISSGPPRPHLLPRRKSWGPHDVSPRLRHCPQPATHLALCPIPSGTFPGLSFMENKNLPPALLPLLYCRLGIDLYSWYCFTLDQVRGGRLSYISSGGAVPGRS